MELVRQFLLFIPSIKRASRSSFLEYSKPYLRKRAKAAVLTKQVRQATSVVTSLANRSSFKLEISRAKRYSLQLKQLARNAKVGFSPDRIQVSTRNL